MAIPESDKPFALSHREDLLKIEQNKYVNKTNLSFKYIFNVLAPRKI